MATIKQFEDVEAWQLARQAVKNVYEVTRSAKWAKDFGLCDQIRRAAVSVMCNIAEGFERGTDKDFARFLFIAKASAGETRSLLYVAKDLGYIEEALFKTYSDRMIKIGKMVSGLIRYLSSRP